MLAIVALGAMHGLRKCGYPTTSVVLYLKPTQAEGSQTKLSHAKKIVLK